MGLESISTVTPCPPVKSTLTPFSRAVSFLWHFPSTHVAQALPGALPYGARTFLFPAPMLGRAKDSCEAAAIRLTLTGHSVLRLGAKRGVLMLLFELNREGVKRIAAGAGKLCGCSNCLLKR